MSTNLQAGDIVILNSGGPKLTVSQVFGSIVDPSIDVAWMNEEGTLQTARMFASMVYPRIIKDRPPVIPNPGETFEAAVRRQWSRSQK